MSDQKQIPSAELSLKYMAWSIKELVESSRKIYVLMEEQTQIFRKMLEIKSKGDRSPPDQEMLF